MTDNGYSESNAPENFTIKSDGLKIHVNRTGTGTPLVLVHGWGSDTQHNWIDTGWIDALRVDHSVISIDARGHGESEKPYSLEPYSYGAMSRDVINVMDFLELPVADFMGYSMGSFIGAYLLGHQPTRFRSMLLGGIGDETEQSAAQGEAIAKALRADNLNTLDSAGKGIRKFVEAISDNDLESLAFSAAKMWPEGYPLKVAGSGIADADLPVLIVNGECDRPYVDSADQFANALPNARHLIIPGTDHLTTVTDKRFKAAAIDFFRSQRQGS